MPPPKKKALADDLISPLHWTMILESVHEGFCVPFLGAAANISSTARNYAGLPMGPEVALQLIGLLLGRPVQAANDLARVTGIIPRLKELGLAEDLARLWVQNLPRVALHVEAQGGDRPFLTKKLRDILPEQQREPSGLLRVLAELPLRLIVTTNFDRLLERAIEKACPLWLAVRPDDLGDGSAWVRALHGAADPLSAHLRAELSPATRQQVDGAAALSLQDLAADLDRILHGPNLYDAQRFAAIPLTDSTLALCQQPLAGTELLRCNRLLLEEAYPAALRKARKSYQVIVQPASGFDDREGLKLQTDPPDESVLVVYKLHGSFTDLQQPDPGLVITEEDYIQFLTVLNDRTKGVPNHVRQKFVGSSLLFLGYSLEDWDFRTLYKALIEPLPHNQRRNAFAIQWNPPKFWVDYWKKKGIHIYDCDVYDFAETLERKYVATYGSLSARKGP